MKAPDSLTTPKPDHETLITDPEPVFQAGIYAKAAYLPRPKPGAPCGLNPGGGANPAGGAPPNAGGGNVPGNCGGPAT